MGPNNCLSEWVDKLETIREISRMLLTLSCALNSSQFQSTHPLNGLNIKLNWIFLFFMICYIFYNEQGSMQWLLLAILANYMASLWIYLQQKPEKNLSPSNSSLKATLLSQYKEREWETWGEIFMVSWLSIILTWHKIQLIQIDYGLNCLCSSLA